MTARRIDGQAVARARHDDIARRSQAVFQVRGRPPCLAALSIGDDHAWRVYQRRQRRLCEQLGLNYHDASMPADCSQDQLLAAIDRLNADDAIDGIIVQAPLPAACAADVIQERLCPIKDVEGVNPINLGLVLAGRDGFAPCTARAAWTLAQTAANDVRGLEAVVVGASVIVGRPVAQLLLGAEATVSVCHIATRDLAFHTRRAELLVVAVGKAGLITGDMVRPGAIVIDVGINRVIDDQGQTRTVGDVDASVWEVAGAVTPVPGGVGSLTTTILVENTVAAAERR